MRPDQVALYDKWQAERDAVHKRERERRQASGEGKK